MSLPAVAAGDRNDPVLVGPVLYGMEKRARFVASYVVFWIACFGAARIIFLAYQSRLTSLLPAGFTVVIALHGLKLDVATACWFSILPALIMARSGFIPASITRRIIALYTGLLLVICAFIITADLAVFAAWGSRIDASLIPYLSTPDVARAAIGGSPLPMLLLIVMLMSTIATVAFVNLVLPVHDLRPEPSGEQSLAMLIIALLLLIPARGGFNQYPITQSSVYFSRNDFANQAAVNPVWSFVYSLNGSTPQISEYTFADSAKATAIVDSLVGSSDGLTPKVRLLRVQPRTIVLLVWESLTAKVIEPMGGTRNITPGFSRLAKDGILFTGIYATGTRTPVGIPALLSGNPALAKALAIQSSDKTADLPSLAASLSKEGYHSAFVYGGNPDFMNIRRYILTMGFDTMIVKSQLADRRIDFSWAVQDHRVLERSISYINSARKPAFVTILTLSSHEPFEVPMETVITGSDTQSRFLNSQVYADRSVSAFIKSARRQQWWNDALVIIIGDHGSHFPERLMQSDRDPDQFHIPMLWLGGALATRNVVIPSVGSQIDLPKLLLDELTLPSDQFKWSKNFLNSGAPRFAYYAFDNGFGYVESSGSLTFDNVRKTVISRNGKPAAGALAAGRAFQQETVEAYLKLGTTARVRAAADNHIRETKTK